MECVECDTGDTGFFANICDRCMVASVLGAETAKYAPEKGRLATIGLAAVLSLGDGDVNVVKMLTNASPNAAIVSGCISTFKSMCDAADVQAPAPVPESIDKSRSGDTMRKRKSLGREPKTKQSRTSINARVAAKTGDPAGTAIMQCATIDQHPPGRWEVKNAYIGGNGYKLVQYRNMDTDITYHRYWRDNKGGSRLFSAKAYVRSGDMRYASIAEITHPFNSLPKGWKIVGINTERITSCSVSYLNEELGIRCSRRWFKGYFVGFDIDKL